MGCAGVPLIEQVIIQDTFVSGVDHIETIGGECARLVWYVEEVDGNSPTRTTTVKLMIPHKCMPIVARKLLRYMAAQCIEIGTQIFAKMLSS